MVNCTCLGKIFYKHRIYNLTSVTLSMDLRMPENNNLQAPEIQWKRLAFFTLGFSAILLIYRFFAEPYLAPSPLKTIYNSQWITYFSHDSSLHFSAPADLNMMFLPEKIDYMQYIQSFQYDADGGLEISVNIAVYESGETVNLTGALQGALHELSKIQGLTIIKNEVEDVQHRGKMFSIQKGEFVLSDTRYHYVNLVSAGKEHLWQMTATYPASDLYGEKIARKMKDNFNILL